MSHNRNIDWLVDRNIIYRQDPVDDIPTIDTDKYMFFEDGTYQHYYLFNSKAKINTYKSLKWHLIVLWYLNPHMDQELFNKLATLICNKDNGFVTFNVSTSHYEQLVYDVLMYDLEKPPKNRLRKVVFKDYNMLTVAEKLSIVGKLIGKSKLSDAEIYDAMLLINDNNEKITINRLAKLLKCSARTIYRNMSNELKKEKELLNKQL